MSFDPKRVAKLIGGNNFRVYHGYAAFATTGTTVDCNAGGMKTVWAVVALPVGAPNANEPLSVNETVDANGCFAVGTDGTFSMQRAAGTSSGLGFYYLLIGK